MKTVMFWCLEEKSEKLWQSSTLIFCVCFCISKLKSFVEKRFLPNYFIRKRNQFILSELTRNIQIKIVQCLDSFLKDPTASISLILPTYKVYQNTPRVLLNRISQERLIENWLRLRVFIAQQYHAPAGCEFWKLYDGYNINKILLRCHEVLEKLKTVSYAQPFVKILQNCMGVLQYVLLMKEKQTFACTKHSINRRKYTNFMELSFAGEVTNTNLRIATCYLDDGVTEDCLKIIQTVTGQTNRFKVNYKQHVIQKLNRAIEDFQNMEPICKDTEIEMYNRIIRKDLTDQDPYKTIEEFEIMKKTGNCVGGYDVFNLIWKQFWFDVTFMPAELPVLPKPAALELCIDNSQQKISFHPFLYGLLLKFLCYTRNGSIKLYKDEVIEIMKICISVMPDEQQYQKCKGINFVTYCCCVQKDYSTACRYVLIIRLSAC
ncbi:uncharacterized protein [Mytilus edulis]|uniref:uncharacterized protein n=1 Tax=Mytilus edulis TaxID=6550 RepID=UPI0039F07D30